MAQAPDLANMLQVSKAMMEQLRPYFEALGISMEIDRIDISPKDCPDTCIDIVYRFRCVSKEVCDKIRDRIRESVSG